MNTGIGSDDILAAMAIARKILRLPSQLGVQDHPAVLACVGRAVAGKCRLDHLLQKILPNVVYRLELEDQFRDMSSASEQHAQVASAVAKQQAKMLPRIHLQ